MIPCHVALKNIYFNVMHKLVQRSGLESYCFISSDTVNDKLFRFLNTGVLVY